MNINNFVDGECASQEVKKQAEKEYKEINTTKSKYLDEISYKNNTGEDVFDFEKNKNELIKDLTFLKGLQVEEFTFYKKYKEVQSTNRLIKSYADQAKSIVWKPIDINDEKLTIDQINNLQPKVIAVNDDEKLNTLWTTLRIYCHTMGFSQSPGRFLKFLMIDEPTGKVLGVTSIASDVINISDRDNYIGWNTEDKLKYKMINHTAIASTISATQPFGSNFLGGKLTAALITTDVVRNAWENEKKIGESKGCKLVGLTTTSLYGPFSMYNSLKWWKPVGSSKGKIPIIPFDTIYEDWHKWIKQHDNKNYEKSMTQKDGIAGPVTAAKMRVLSMIFKACGLQLSHYYHGYIRGLYFASIYENSREFLCRKTTEDKLVMKPLFKGNVDEILKWWRPKACNRYLTLKKEGRLNPKRLFYSDMDNMSYEDAKNKYLKDVGK